MDSARSLPAPCALDKQLGNRTRRDHRPFDLQSRLCRVDIFCACVWWCFCKPLSGLCACIEIVRAADISRRVPPLHTPDSCNRRPAPPTDREHTIALSEENKGESNSGRDGCKVVVCPELQGEGGARTTDAGASAPACARGVEVRGEETGCPPSVPPPHCYNPFSDATGNSLFSCSPTVLTDSALSVLAHPAHM